MRTFDENPPPPDPPEPTSDRRTTAKKWAGGSVGESWFDAVVDHVNATETHHHPAAGERRPDDG